MRVSLWVEYTQYADGSCHYCARVQYPSGDSRHIHADGATAGSTEPYRFAKPEEALAAIEAYKVRARSITPVEVSRSNMQAFETASLA